RVGRGFRRPVLFQPRLPPALRRNAVRHSRTRSAADLASPEASLTTAMRRRRAPTTFVVASPMPAPALRRASRSGLRLTRVLRVEGERIATAWVRRVIVIHADFSDIDQ